MRFIFGEVDLKEPNYEGVLKEHPNFYDPETVDKFREKYPTMRLSVGVNGCLYEVEFMEPADSMKLARVKGLSSLPFMMTSDLRLLEDIAAAALLEERSLCQQLLAESEYWYNLRRGKIYQLTGYTRPCETPDYELTYRPFDGDRFMTFHRPAWEFRGRNREGKQRFIPVNFEKILYDM